MASTLSNLSLPGMPGLFPVLAFLAKATLLLLLALAGAAALRRASAGARHILWSGALAALVLLPGLSSWAPWRLEVLPSELALPAWAHAADTHPTAGVAPRGGDPTPGDALGGERLAHPGGVTAPDQKGTRLDAQASSSDRFPQIDPRASSLDAPSSRTEAGAGSIEVAGGTLRLTSVWGILLTLWVVGALASLARLGVGAITVRRIVRGARRLDAPDFTAPLWEVADRLDLARAPRLVCSDRVSMPFACGLLQPTIVLPPEAHEWSDDRRRAVLFHELAHVRRRDLLTHTLGRIACALYWFHPLVWGAARRMRAESERACDDLVLAAGTRASEYADHLLQILTSVRSASAPSVALAMARRKEFEGRMLAILDPELRRAAPGRLQSGALLLGLAALAVSVSAMAPARGPSNPASGAVARDSLPPANDSVSSSVSSMVRETVRPAVQETVRPVVDEAVDNLPDDHLDDHGSTDRRALAELRRTMRDAMTASFAGELSSTPVHADSGAVEALVRVLQTDTDPSVRKTAAWALVQRGGRAALAPLTAALQHDTSAAVREMAAWGLGQSEDRGAVQALSAAVRGDADARVRLTAVWALGQIEDESAIPTLEAALGDSSTRVRDRAAWALGQIEPAHAPQGLGKALHDGNARVREKAAWALGQIGDPDVVPALSAALRAERDRDVRRMEVRALLLLGESSDAALTELLRSPDAEIRLRATRALAGYGAGAWPMPMPMPMPRPIP